MHKFQSYIILGQSEDIAREQSEEIAKSFSIANTSKPSQDVTIISPIKTAIQIDQIRDLKTHIFQKPLREKFKLVIIEKADKLTTEAQNALLKIFEEPPPHAVIILEAKNKKDLLATIISRAVVIETLKTPKKEELKILDGLKSLDAIENIENPEEFLNGQMVTLTNLLVQKIKGKKVDFSQETLKDAITKCKDAKNMINSNINPTFVLTNLIFNLNQTQKNKSKLASK